MKTKTTKAAMLLVLLISVKWGSSQNVGIDGFTSPLPVGGIEKLQVKNGLLTHYVSGTVGLFGLNDQWMGLGKPGPAPVYGIRTQWKSQALNLALRDNGNLLPDAILEWGNGSSSLSPFSIRTIVNQIPIGGGTPIQNVDYYNMMQFDSKSLNISVGPNINPTYFTRLGVFDGFGPTSAPTPIPSLPGISTAAIYGVTDGRSYNSNTSLQGVSLDYAAGVIGDVYNSQANLASYGVLGIGRQFGGQWAGYFVGKTFSSGAYSGSDIKLKKQISKEESALKKLMQLNPSQYYFDTEKYKSMNLEPELQHGFIAQELEKVFPEMVTTVNAPSPVDATTRKAIDPFSFKAVNYNQLHAIEVAAIQELNAKIEILEKQLASKTNQVLVITEAKTAEIKTLEDKAFMIAQNVPNPFTSTTTIKYTIPQNNTAMIAVFDLNGKMLLQFPNLKGSAQITINGNTLQAGMYLYSLLVNGQEIITKKMILTK